MNDKGKQQLIFKTLVLAAIALLIVVSVSPVIANGGSGGNDGKGREVTTRYGETLSVRECRGTYSVNGGDNLSMVAAMCNVPLDALLEANSWIGDDFLIRPGQLITIPRGNWGNLSTPGGGDFFLTNRGPAFSPSGDMEDAFLWRDALDSSSQGTTGQGTGGLPGTGGQVQVTGTVTATATVPATATTQPQASPTAQATPLPATGGQNNNQGTSGDNGLMGLSLQEWRGRLRERECRSTYSVRPGDNLFIIAAMCDVPLDVIREANAWIGDDLVIRPGDRINLPSEDYGEINANTGGDYILTNWGPIYSPTGRLEDAIPMRGNAGQASSNQGSSSGGLPGTGGQSQPSATITSTATVTGTATPQATPLPGTGGQGSNQNNGLNTARMMGLSLDEWRDRLRQRECGNTYSVRPGDNIFIIAAMCDAPVDALQEANAWIGDDLVIRPGDRVSIPQGDYGDINANTGGDYILTNWGPVYSPTGKLADALP